MQDPIIDDIERDAEAAMPGPSRVAALFALMWAWFLGLVGKADAPKDGTFKRVVYKRQGFKVWLVDRETREDFGFEADSVPEAKQFCAAIAIGAERMPKASAREVADAAAQLVTKAREARNRT